MNLQSRLQFWLSSEKSTRLFYARPDEKYTYLDASKLIGSYCKYFSDCGFTVGDIVAIESEKQFATYCMHLACYIYGLTYIPFTKEQSLIRVSEVVSELNTLAVFYSSEKSAQAFTVRGIKTQEISTIPTQEYLFKSFAISGDVDAYIMFSSGSTGSPKSIPISRDNLEAYIDSIESIVDIQENSAFSQVAALTFDLSVHDIYLCFSNSGHICPIKTNEAILAYRFVNELSIKYWMSVPSTALFMYRYVNKVISMPSLECSFFLGEALVTNTAKEWCQSAENSKVFNLYGPTECTVAASYFDLDEMGDNFGGNIVPIGRPLKNCLLRMCPNNSELLLGGDQLFTGYLAASVKENVKKIECNEDGRYYRSGDLVSYDNDLGYIFKGRLDFQVKVRGYRIELEDLESILKAKIGADVCVLPAREIQTGNYDSVAVVYENRFSESEISGVVAVYFPNYISVSQYLVVDNVSRNTNGKLDRKLMKTFIND